MKVTILINQFVDLMLLSMAVTVIAMIIFCKRAEKQDLLEESNNSNWLNYKVEEVKKIYE
ncbi:MAG: hypothetical protein WBF08_08005 [Candidatus Bathyarchaeia archaeon]